MVFVLDDMKKRMYIVRTVAALMIASGILFIDQLTKFLIVVSSIKDTYSIAAYGDCCFFIELIENRGFIWGFGDAYGLAIQTMSLGMLCVLLSGMVFLFLSDYVHNLSRISVVGFACILGGGLSNFIDRVLFGFVFDWLCFSYGHFSWAVFNVADIAIVIGCILLAFHAYRHK